MNYGKSFLNNSIKLKLLSTPIWHYLTVIWLRPEGYTYLTWWHTVGNVYEERFQKNQSRLWFVILGVPWPQSWSLNRQSERGPVLKSCIVLSTGHIIIQWISIRETNFTIGWVEIYSVDWRHLPFEQLPLAQEDFGDQFRRSFYKSLLILKYHYVGSHLWIGKVSENQYKSFRWTWNTDFLEIIRMLQASKGTTPFIIIKWQNIFCHKNKKLF